MKSPSWCTGNRPRSVAPRGQSKYLLVAFPGVSNQLSSLSSTKSQLNPGQNHTRQVCMQNSVCKPGELRALQTNPGENFCTRSEPCVWGRRATLPAWGGTEHCK